MSFPCSLQRRNGALEDSFIVYGLNNVTLDYGSTSSELTIPRKPHTVSLTPDVQFNVACNVNLLSPRNSQLCYFNIYSTPQFTLNITNPVIFSCPRNISELKWWMVEYNKTHFVHMQNMNISGSIFNTSLYDNSIIICGTEKNNTIHVFGIGTFQVNANDTGTNIQASDKDFPTISTNRVPESATKSSPPVPSVDDGSTNGITSESGEATSKMALSLAFVSICLVVVFVMGICGVFIFRRISTKFKEPMQPELQDYSGSNNNVVLLNVSSTPRHLQPPSQIDTYTHMGMTDVFGINNCVNVRGYGEWCLPRSLNRSTMGKRSSSEPSCQRPERGAEMSDSATPSSYLHVGSTMGATRHTIPRKTSGRHLLNKGSLPRSGTRTEEQRNLDSSEDIYFTIDDLGSRQCMDTIKSPAPEISKCVSLDYLDEKKTEKRKSEAYFCKNCSLSLVSISRSSNPLSSYSAVDCCHICKKNLSSRVKWKEH